MLNNLQDNRYFCKDSEYRRTKFFEFLKCYRFLKITPSKRGDKTLNFSIFHDEEQFFSTNLIKVQQSPGRLCQNQAKKCHEIES